MSRTRVLVSIFGAWCLFVVAYSATGHEVDPVSTACVIFIYGSLFISARMRRGGFRPKVKLVLSAEEREAQRKRQRIPPGLAWWYRLSDRARRLDEAAWPGGIAWPEGEPLKRRHMRPLVVGTPASTVVIVLGIIAASSLGLPFWLALLLGLVVGVIPLSVYVAWRLVQEARRQGWGGNLS